MNASPSNSPRNDAACPAGSPRGLSPALLALLGAALALAAPFVHLSLLGNSLSRTTALPALVLLAAAVGLTLAAARRGRRLWHKVVCGLVLGFGLLFGGAHFGLTGLPPAQGPAGERYAELTVVDHTGATVRFADELARGPLLLVFYRGHW